MSRKALAPVWRIIKAPGRGLLTVSTGAEQQRKLIDKFIPPRRRNSWPNYVKARLANPDKVPGPSLIGFPSDSGGGICRGAAHGPLGLRPLLYSKGWAPHDLGDIPCIPQLSHDKLLSPKQKKACEKQLWNSSSHKTHPVSPLNLLREFLQNGYQKQARAFKPLVLGGDHSLSLPCVEALHKSGLLKDCGILHFDAHTDLMETRFGVDYCFATWASHASKLLDKPEKLLQVGLRQSSESKKHWEGKFGVKQIWMSEVKSKTAAQLTKQICSHFEKLNCKHLYLSIDIDCLDQRQAPSTGTPELKGMSTTYLTKVIDQVTKRFSVLGADLVEVAPVLGSKQDAQKTVKAAVQLIEAIHW
ncbi:arginase family protein [bacterium]|nr:arginase family protein [bacterium]